MTRVKSLCAAAVMAVITAAVPAANAVTCTTGVHFVGAGSSAQFLMAAIAADQAAINENSSCGLGETVQHWTKKAAANVIDGRDARILPENGNIWIVWLQDGSGNVTDLWTDVSVDSTVGVRTFSAQITGAGAPGAQVQTTGTNGLASDNLVSPNSPFSALWPDNTADVNLTTNVINTINTSDGGVHVNVGLTDIRPEDAFAATTRALGTLNTSTYSGLGYKGVTSNIGAPIYSFLTTSQATPVTFALQGKADPISKVTVPAYTTFPLGAAPIVFIANNGGSSPEITDLVSGVTPAAHVTGQTYPAEQLFAGLVACDTHATAFGGNGDKAGTPLTLFLREPLSGTMNTTEFTLFRTTGNTSGSQETGVINPLNKPYNPMDISCPTHGVRERAIGTGEVVGKSGSYGVLNTAHSLGYIFFGFSNAAKLATSAFNYLTIDGVDPIGLGTANQGFPNCSGTTCPASLWSGSLSYPHLRDGTYKAWSIYRWLAYNANTAADPDFGPSGVSQIAQDYVDADVADFVPFSTSTDSDGLEVYRSHFTVQGVTGNNGSVTTANSLDHGNTLGGGTEAGGDVGGLIEGPFGTTLSNHYGYVTISSTFTANKGYHVTWKQNAKFTAGTSWEGATIAIGGVNYTISTNGTTSQLTTTSLYVGCIGACGTTATGPTPPTTTVQLFYSAPFSITYPAATAPGVLNKKQ